MKFKTPSTHFDNAPLSDKLVANSLHIVGFEFDGTACYRKGTALGPDEIREASYNIETYSPYLDLDTADLKSCYDLGNLCASELKDVESNWWNATNQFLSLTENIDLAKENIKFLTLGGEHSISYAPIKRYLENYPNLVLIHLDAHADLRDGYEGYTYSHASIIRRVYDHFGKNHQLIQYGIRSGTKEEFHWMKENKTRCLSFDEFINTLHQIADENPIYLTLDLDYFDPAYMPGTGTPEAGGETYHSFIKMNKILKEKNFVGADVVELAPNIDQTGNSTVLAANIVRELILSLQWK